MEQNTDRKTAAGLGFIGRGLGELLELKASFRHRLEYLEQHRDRLSEYVFNKLSHEYRAYLQSVDGEVELGLSEYEIKLAEIRLFSNQLKLLEKSYSEKLEELSLRHSLGEFGDEQYQRLCAEHEAKLKRFAGSLEKYRGQKQKLEAFLSRVDWRREPEAAAVQAVKQEPERATVTDQDLTGEGGRAPVAEPVQGEVQPVQPDKPLDTGAGPPPPPPGGDGPPSSSLLELESALDKAPPEPAPRPVEQPAAIEAPPEPEGLVEDLPGQSQPPPVEEIAQPAALPEPPEKDVPEGEPQSDGTHTPAPVPTEPEPEEPVMDTSAQKPFELEVDLPDVPAAMERQGQDGPVTNDLEALMGGAVSAAQPEPESAATADTPASAGEASGFDLDDIFGSAPSVPEQEQKPAPEQEPSAEAGSAPETVASPEIAEPVRPEQSQAPAAIGNIEDELLHDLAATLPADQAGEEPPEPEPAEADDGFDLGGLMDQAGAAAVPDSEPPLPEQSRDTVSRTREPEREQSEPLVEPAQAAPVAEPADTPQPEQMQPSADEPRPKDMEPRNDTPPQPERGGGTDSLVSQALQRAARESAGQNERIGAEVAADLDDGVELTADGEAGEGEVLLTMNQTIDAIKKKTVKCPNCGTMNYAIRWYCEHCESTLTAL